jgi:hypothetical protein
MRGDLGLGPACFSKLHHFGMGAAGDIRRSGHELELGGGLARAQGLDRALEGFGVLGREGCGEHQVWWVAAREDGFL